MNFMIDVSDLTYEDLEYIVDILICKYVDVDFVIERIGNKVLLKNREILI